MPNFDHGYEEPLLKVKTKPELPKKEESSMHCSTAKKSAGIQGMFEKQKGTVACKEISNDNQPGKEKTIQSKNQQKAVTKNPPSKGK